MKHQNLFGITCDLKDEKKIHQAINDYLSKFNRTTSTVKKGPLMESRLPYRIKQFHWNLNKETGTWLELFPNQDLEGKYFWQKRKDCARLILVLLHNHFPGFEKNKSEKFILDLLNSVGFNNETLAETDSEERLAGDALL